MKNSKEHKRTEATQIKVRFVSWTPKKLRDPPFDSYSDQKLYFLLKGAEPKTTRNKLRHGINKEERKEKRIAHEDG